ncbi:MAG: NAD+ kinase [Candidatus Eremiobacteraeota bacterium]|nr:NAD+ kinase [Candidatus Eremiobacteraeota bacterium]
MEGFDKIVVVTRKTRLEGLMERFVTAAQAKFYIEHAGGDFSEYREEHDTYMRSREQVLRALDMVLKLQVIDRGLVPTYLFASRDIVVTIGQDGLVANTAKYVAGQPIVAVNPDPGRIDGVLLPFRPQDARGEIERILKGRAHLRKVTLAEAQLNDGQRLLAFNDLFIGASSHVSARYHIRWRGKKEPHSSSGVIVSTGAGSTGWLSSLFTMTRGIAAFLGGESPGGITMTWDEERLIFVVREPFVSRHSKADTVAGILERAEVLELESLMPSGGVIFSDGIEADYLAFNAGALVRVKAAEQSACLAAREAGR